MSDAAPPHGPATAPPTAVSFGHGTAGQDELATLLTGAGVGLVVDVRRFPGSRRHPHTATDELARWLPEHGVDYRWEPRLGGRRRLTPEEADADPWWRVEAFRAYAAYTRTDEFRAGLDELLVDLAARADVGQAVAFMCSESLWWRCHRRLVSDVFVALHDVPVAHLGHDGRLTPHEVSAGARVAEDGLRYDREP
ncbi:DUF488 family protein [Nocardioides perillae]|uniref:Uncharacterized protein (DUF488 family) n=1 Tax=Nocardioides perillae TaxID=1119534 RepID=A0A7Y9RR14_9ACTN|nr:DUF488 domain-containing protein [Nocardioides perillae]NYG54982.1 uncharacterized protein (DUF488 family) [Nocardioides perillae]